jgi:serine/threonine protein phosphatase PrpC
MSFFGIFDGHGKDGHLCARFASKVLPIILSESISKFENVTYRYLISDGEIPSRNIQLNELHNMPSTTYPIPASINKISKN